MARTEYITRSTTAQKLQSPRRAAEPVVVDDEGKQPKLATAPEVDDESELLIPEPVSTASSKPADEAASMTTTHSTPEKPTTIKKIILHLPPPPVLTALQTLPVDTIISDMTAANGGIPPCSAEILVEAIKWFKHAYRTAISPRVVRSAAEQILEQLDTVMSGNPAYRHNIPRGMAYERLEVQRKFLRAIIHIHCGMLNDLEVFDMIVTRD